MMKFIVLFVLAMAPGFERNIDGEVHPFIFTNRQQCQDAMDWAAYKMEHVISPSGVAGMRAYACIQVDGPITRFPVREQIAEGWERA